MVDGTSWRRKQYHGRLPRAGHHEGNTSEVVVKEGYVEEGRVAIDGEEGYAKAIIELGHTGSEFGAIVETVWYNHGCHHQKTNMICIF